MIDFESSFASAFVKCFPDAEISGCHFHFGQRIWRKVQSVGLQVRYGQDSNFVLSIKMLVALAFVPVDDVINAFETLTQSEYFSEDNESVESVLGYFETTWIGSLDRRKRRRSPCFPIYMWNCYDAVVNDLLRTNNAVEGWHRAFNERVRISHASINKFINVLKSEQSTLELLIAQSRAGRKVQNKKRKKYADYDKRLKNVVLGYIGANILEYLCEVANNITL
ncbi:uncharacterized protein LOC112465968 [Temnothorax curvispinosus]|uniref:Uncharacterized protein LOC112465968 n=1 Tax=Temnothorax curvispinosus TaxID=300111 RepID=A0A6J1R9W0_9HYME|nr:uncharacterized protein LOC112465968 [Temnothorax curvispinosus]